MLLVTKNGMVIRFAAAAMPISSRTAQGVKGMNLNDGDSILAALPISNPADSLAIVATAGLGKKVALSEFSTQNRGGKGVIVYKGEVAGAAIVSEESSLLINGKQSSIVIDCKDLPSLSRVSTGNQIMKNKTEIVSITEM